LSAPPAEGRRRWTAGELTEIVTVLATFSTSEIARTLGVNPKALRSALRRHGISIRTLREREKKTAKEHIGFTVRRSSAGPSALYGATALAALPDGACRWPVGDPSEPDFAFCGAPQFGRAAYCCHHLVKAFEQRNCHGH
jgi:GcrA cell cycle regulator